jgi:hypothetical protein
MSENIGSALERAIQLYADREAVVDGDRRWTYAELHRRVGAFDSALNNLGLSVGDVVGVLSLNSAEHLIAWLAIPRSGRILNDLNYRLAPSELEFILGDCQTRVLLADDAFLDVAIALAAASPTVEHVIHIGPGETPSALLRFADLTSGEGTAVSNNPDPGTVAGIFYTGGTTGTPKGVMLTHANLVANAKHVLIAFGYTEDDSYLHAAPIVPPRGRCLDVGGDMGGRPPRCHPCLRSARLAPNCEQRTGDPGAARPDDDQHGRQPSRCGAVRPLVAAHALLRRIADARAASAARDGNAPVRVGPSLRNDRSGPARHLPDPGRSPPRPGGRGAVRRSTSLRGTPCDRR